MNLTQDKIKALIEAMLFLSASPLSVRQMVNRLKLANERSLANSESYDQPSEPEQEQENPEIASEEEQAAQQLLNKQKEQESEISHHDVKAALKELLEEYAQSHHGFELVQVAQAYQFRSKVELMPLLKEEKKAVRFRLSSSALETLAIIAYKQPVNRSQIEEVRGVDAGGVLKTLLDKELIRIVGRSDELGRPLVYGTTNRFLEIFTLNSLKDLPNPSEFSFEDIAANSIDLMNNSDVILDDEMLNSEMQLDEADQEILGELDSSLENLKSVEKGIDYLSDDSQQTETEN